MKIRKFSKTNSSLWIHLIASICGILWLLLALFNYNSIKNITYKQEGKNNTQQNINMEWEGEIWSINQYNNAQIIPLSEEERNILDKSYKAKSYVKDFYNYMNNQNFQRFYSIQDNAFKQDQDIQIYFSENRIIKFLAQINGTLKPQEIKEVQDDRKDTDFVSRRGFKYFLKYEIKDIIHKEVWKMILISTDWWHTYQVNSLFCETKNCWNLPFYK